MHQQLLILHVAIYLYTKLASGATSAFYTRRFVLIDNFQLSAQWPGLCMAAKLEVTYVLTQTSLLLLCKSSCFHVLIYTTKAEIWSSVIAPFSMPRTFWHCKSFMRKIKIQFHDKYTCVSLSSFFRFVLLSCVLFYFYFHFSIVFFSLFLHRSFLFSKHRKNYRKYNSWIVIFISALYFNGNISLVITGGPSSIYE